MIVVDTNAISDFWRGVSQVLLYFEKPEAVYIPSVVVGELYYMLLNSNRKAENLARLDAFIDQHPISRPSPDTEYLYGYVVYQLKRKGLSIPDHDAWIAATALQLNAPVLSRDKHLRYVDEITVISWPVPPK